MRILLVQPKLNWAHPWAESPSLALLTLGTLAQNEGHIVKVLHLDIDDGNFPASLAKFKPDILGITCNTFQVKSARKITVEARQFNPDLKIVVGGPHAPVFDGEHDEIVIGEGENHWLELLGAKRRLNSLDDIPPLDYSQVKLDRFSGISPVGASPSMAIMASRGCPFECTFCNTPIFWGKHVRYRNPKAVIDEVEYLQRHYGVREIFFQDDTFNLNQDWAIEIFDRIISNGLGLEMCFKICCRVNEKLFTQKFLNKAKEAGVWNIFFGIESGSQFMLDKMKKGITTEEVERAIEMTNEVHIHSQCSFILGLPGETHGTINETIDFIHRIKPASVGYCYACPFPLTELDRLVTEKGHKKKMDYADYAYGLVMARTDALDFSDLESYGSMVYGT